MSLFAPCSHHAAPLQCRCRFDQPWLPVQLRTSVVGLCCGGCFIGFIGSRSAGRVGGWLPAGRRLQYIQPSRKDSARAPDERTPFLEFSRLQAAAMSTRMWLLRSNWSLRCEPRVGIELKSKRQGNPAFLTHNHLDLLEDGLNMFWYST